ncbi:anthranilate phosphoribosyltransferase, partial [Magnetococcales bacterium HHB-1]
EDGLDEITTTGITHVAELHDDKKVTTYTIHPEQFGLNQASAEDLAGGDAQTNAKITLDILDNQEGAKKDIVALNAAAAIYITGAAKSIQEGLGQAEYALSSGRAKQRLQALIEGSQVTP